MTDEEVEIVALELAKVGGLSWYPGREKGVLLRAVTERYRDQARAAIAAFDRCKSKKAKPNIVQKIEAIRLDVPSSCA
ncbi:hypothetical protein FEZ63_20515 [Microvirga brassicacearum]|uniref:Uncharacterized protein n=1 Tax=Microvirga brassicacearum TaxID=2580413 RepID=A0A5N3P5L3_9HYPH|nr:hypothetical protein FEZ63_20515 [Microvirga brassicacearum]